jgi:hypothetical protein
MPAKQLDAWRSEDGVAPAPPYDLIKSDNTEESFEPAGCRFSSDFLFG